MLASFQALALVNCCSLLSRRGALALVPFGLHLAALLLGVGGIAVAFEYGPTACAASLTGCAAVKLSLVAIGAFGLYLTRSLYGDHGVGAVQFQRL